MSMDFSRREISIRQHREHREVKLRCQSFLGPLKNRIHVSFGTGTSDREVVFLQTATLFWSHDLIRMHVGNVHDDVLFNCLAFLAPRAEEPLATG